MSLSFSPADLNRWSAAQVELQRLFELVKIFPGRHDDGGFSAC